MLDDKRKKYTAQEWHKKSAVELFNLVWTLIDKKERSEEENDGMINAAHASRYHWEEIGTPLEIERGEWQISHVYAILKRGEPALYHAKKCLKICEENGFKDFDIAFAYEAMARAYSIANNKIECEKYLKMAKKAGKEIKKKEDRDIFLNELETISDCNKA